MGRQWPTGSVQDQVVAGGTFLPRGGLITFPALRHEVQTLIRFGVPLTNARTVCRLGFHRRLVKLWAWETLFPKVGFLPQISQALAISILDFFLSVLLRDLDLYHFLSEKARNMCHCISLRCGVIHIPIGSAVLTDNRLVQ